MLDTIINRLGTVSYMARRVHGREWGLGLNSQFYKYPISPRTPMFLLEPAYDDCEETASMNCKRHFRVDLHKQNITICPSHQQKSGCTIK